MKNNWEKEKCPVCGEVFTDGDNTPAGGYFMPNSEAKISEPFSGEAGLDWFVRICEKCFKKEREKRDREERREGNGENDFMAEAREFTKEEWDYLKIHFPAYIVYYNSEHNTKIPQMERDEEIKWLEAEIKRMKVRIRRLKAGDK